MPPPAPTAPPRRSAAPPPVRARCRRSGRPGGAAARRPGRHAAERPAGARGAPTRRADGRDPAAGAVRASDQRRRRRRPPPRRRRAAHRDAAHRHGHPRPGRYRRRAGRRRRGPGRSGRPRAAADRRVRAGRRAAARARGARRRAHGARHPDAEVARERNRLVERITVARAQPRTIAREALQRKRFGDHPIAREMPTGPDVAAVTADDVRALHADALVPGGAILTLVGDLDPADAAGLVERALGGWTGVASRPRARSAAPRPAVRPGARAPGRLRAVPAAPLRAGACPA